MSARCQQLGEAGAGIVEPGVGGGVFLTGDRLVENVNELLVDRVDIDLGRLLARDEGFDQLVDEELDLLAAGLAIRGLRALASISAASATLAFAGFHLGHPGGGKQGHRAVWLFLRNSPWSARDAGPVLVGLEQRGGGIERVLDHVVRAVRPNGLFVGFERKPFELREFVGLVGFFFL